MSRPFNLFDTAFLEQAMDAASLRGRVIASNISNANTPGYESLQVEFDNDLREAIDEENRGNSRSKPVVKAKVVKAGKKIDVITEMASLAKNQILYNAYANRLSQHFSGLKWVIENSGR